MDLVAAREGRAIVAVARGVAAAAVDDVSLFWSGTAITGIDGLYAMAELFCEVYYEKSKKVLRFMI